jgi:DnaK suppressor protein
MKNTRGRHGQSAATARTPRSRSDELVDLLRTHKEESQRRLRAAKQAVRHDGADRCDGGLDEMWADPLEADVDVAVLEHESRTIRRIDSALERLARGVYGDCVSCGGPIEQKRLRALPFAVRCRPCEEAREQLGLQRPSSFP